MLSSSWTGMFAVPTCVPCIVVPSETITVTCCSVTSVRSVKSFVKWELAPESRSQCRIEAASDTLFWIDVW